MTPDEADAIMEANFKAWIERFYEERKRKARREWARELKEEREAKKVA